MAGGGGFGEELDEMDEQVFVDEVGSGASLLAIRGFQKSQLKFSNDGSTAALPESLVKRVELLAILGSRSDTK